MKSILRGVLFVAVCVAGIAIVWQTGARWFGAGPSSRGSASVDPLAWMVKGALDLGILSPQVFAILVIMALLTTFIAGPVLSWLGNGDSAAVNATTAVPDGA